MEGDQLLAQQLPELSRLLEIVERRALEVEENSVVSQDNIEEEYQLRLSSLNSARQVAFGKVEMLRMEQGSSLRAHAEQLKQLMAIVQQLQSCLPPHGSERVQAMLQQLVADFVFQLRQVSDELDDVEVEFPSTEELLCDSAAQHSTGLVDSKLDALSRNMAKLLQLAQTLLECGQTCTPPPVDDAGGFTFTFPYESQPLDQWLLMSGDSVGRGDNEKSAISAKFSFPFRNLPSTKWLLEACNASPSSSLDYFPHPFDSLPSSQWLTFSAEQQQEMSKTMKFVHNCGNLTMSEWLPSGGADSKASDKSTKSFSNPLASLPSSSWLLPPTSSDSESPLQSSLKQCIWLLGEVSVGRSSGTFSFPLASSDSKMWLHGNSSKSTFNGYEHIARLHRDAAQGKPWEMQEWLHVGGTSHDCLADASPFGGWVAGSSQALSTEAKKSLEGKFSYPLASTETGKWLHSMAPESSKAQHECFEHIANAHKAELVRAHSCPAKSPSKPGPDFSEWLLSSTNNASDSLTRTLKQLSVGGGVPVQAAVSPSDPNAADLKDWLLPCSTSDTMVDIDPSSLQVTMEQVTSLHGADVYNALQFQSVCDQEGIGPWLSPGSQDDMSEAANSEFEVLDAHEAMMEDS